MLQFSTTEGGGNVGGGGSLSARGGRGGSSYSHATPPPPRLGVELDEVRGLGGESGTEDSLTETPRTPLSMGSSFSARDVGGGSATRRGRGTPGLLYTSPGAKVGGGSSAMDVMKRFRKGGAGLVNNSNNSSSNEQAPLSPLPDEAVGTSGQERMGRGERKELLLDGGNGISGAIAKGPKVVQYTMVQQDNDDDAVEEDQLKELRGRGVPAKDGTPMVPDHQPALLHSSLHAPPPQPKFDDLVANHNEEEESGNHDHHGGGGNSSSSSVVGNYLDNKLDGMAKGDIHRKRLARLGLLPSSKSKSSPLLSSAPHHEEEPALLSADAEETDQ
jgi:hypothetical protein